MNQLDPRLETEALWREFHERLRAFISRRVHRQADVEDILQEVFIRIQRGVDSLQRQERLSAWIFQITRNVIADHFRAGNRQPDATGEDFDPPSQGHGGDNERNEATELSACIEPMIAALPQIFREAIELTDLNGLTQVDAAQNVGVSLSGMKSRVQRARRELKNMLLECCRIELDRRGGIVDYSIRDARKSPCGPCGRSEKE
jgi:RNA polymerase sigma-70 factor (ECF subfamily)